MGDLTVVCWKWKQKGYATTFTAEHVNILKGMVERHYRKPHRFVCLTDDPEGIDAETLPVPGQYGEMKNACGDYLPSCYRRLWLFSDEARELLGERRVSIDLDTVITGDLRPLWDRPEPFVGWRVRRRWGAYCYNGSMFLIQGPRWRVVWEAFDPLISPRAALAAKYLGSDQAWMSLVMLDQPDAGVWTASDGVVSLGVELWNQKSLPEGTRIVMCHGFNRRPWDPSLHSRFPWIKEHYR